MFFWIIYFFASLYIAYLLSRLLPKKISFFFFTIIGTILLTPSLIEISSGVLGPSIFIFFFDLLFEQNFSLRPLRPLVFSLPLVLFFLLASNFLKKKFF